MTEITNVTVLGTGVLGSQIAYQTAYSGFVVTAYDIDDAWRTATGAPMGPFQFTDIIGLTTPYNILSHSGEKRQDLAAWLKTTYIDHGKLGISTGEGFYSYD